MDDIKLIARTAPGTKMKPGTSSSSGSASAESYDNQDRIENNMRKENARSTFRQSLTRLQVLRYKRSGPAGALCWLGEISGPTRGCDSLCAIPP